MRELYYQVLIPPAVWKEVVEQGQGRPGAREVEEASRSGWLKVESPTNELLLRLLKRDVDDGEAEAIVLTVEQKAEVILVDQSHARRKAAVYGLQKTGVIGLLAGAKLEGKLPSLREELDRLRQEAGFRVSENLYHQALRAVGEE